MDPYCQSLSLLLSRFLLFCLLFILYSPLSLLKASKTTLISLTLLFKLHF